MNLFERLCLYWPPTSMTFIKLASKSSLLYERVYFQIKQRSTYDNITAREDCLKIMNTSAFQLCSQLPDISFNSVVDDCVLDAIVRFGALLLVT